MKTCLMCAELKPLDAYRTVPANEDGRGNVCKACNEICDFLCVVCGKRGSYSGPYCDRCKKLAATMTYAELRRTVQPDSKAPKEWHEHKARHAA